MILIDGLLVEQRLTEYAIRFPDGQLLECDSQAEAEALSEHWTDITIVQRFVYVTQYAYV